MKKGRARESILGISLYVVVIVALMGCSLKESVGEVQGDSSGDSDRDADTDTGSDTDADADADADTDSDSDTDADADMDADTDGDTDTGCVDDDSDSWCEEFECNDSDSSINPDADEIPDSGVDEDCDGFTDERDNGNIQANCYEPELLVTLDRTLSMGLKVGGEYKWFIATDAIDTLMTTYSDTVRFGLSLFPKDAEGCKTEEELLGTVDPKPTNEHCLEGEIAVEPGPGTQSEITTALSNPRMCISTPIKKGLETAGLYFAANPPNPTDRKQFVLLITDGGETCEKQTVSCTAEALAQNGIPTYVVGFGDEVNPNHLNSLACAGGTASDTSICVTGSSGCVEAQTGQGPVYYQADNSAQLVEDLKSIADVVQCQVVK